MDTIVAAQLPFVPAEKPMPTTRMITFYYDQTDHFMRLCRERGAHFCFAAKVPSWNIYGQQVGSHYVAIYQHHEDIEMEIMT